MMTTHIPTALRTIWQILSDERYAIMLSEKLGFRYIHSASHLRLAPDDKLVLRAFLNRSSPHSNYQVQTGFLRIRAKTKPR